jgi:hypothetical protein
MASKALKLAVGLLTCVSVSLPPSLAEARPRWAGYYGGYGYPAYYGGYGYPAYYGGYYPAYYGGYPAYYGGYYPGYYYGGPVYYRRRRSNAGAALAVGLIGGIALGAILASAARSQRAYYRPVRYRRR